MNRFKNWLTGLLKGESGLEPVQYAVVLALLVVAILGGLRLLGNAANNQNNSTSNMLQKAGSQRGPGAN